MRFSLILILSLCVPVLQAKAAVGFNASCTIIYSLERNAEQYFLDEVVQLNEQLIHQNIRLIDLNNWYYDIPYLDISGRERHLLREQYQLPATINQAVVLNSSGQEIARFSGSVTLVNALLACPA